LAQFISRHRSLIINFTVAIPPRRLGLFGVGLDAYWSQFRGLKARLEGYIARAAQKLARPGVEIVNLGLVDNADRAYAAGREFRRQDVDIIVLYVTTYALSSTKHSTTQRYLRYGGIR
jgi:L-arabinose isomerase